MGGGSAAGYPFRGGCDLKVSSLVVMAAYSPSHGAGDFISMGSPRLDAHGDLPQQSIRLAWSISEHTQVVARSPSTQPAARDAPGPDEVPSGRSESKSESPIRIIRPSLVTRNLSDEVPRSRTGGPSPRGGRMEAPPCCLMRHRKEAQLRTVTTSDS